MAGLRAYLFSIVSVCMIAAVVAALVRGHVVTRVVKIMTGVLILLVVLQPLTNLDPADLSQGMDFFSESQDLIDHEKDRTHQRFMEQVAFSAQTHIEQIALKFGASITAKVCVSDDEIPIPTSVEIFGTLQPDQLRELSDYIAEYVGIEKENQHWRDYE